MRNLGLAGLLLALSWPADADSSRPAVDAALVLAVDVSLSVDDTRYALQKEGIAAALTAPEVLAAIGSGRHRAVAITVLEFSDPDRAIAILPWTRIADGSQARAIADRLRRTARSSDGLTGITGALLASRALLAELPFQADRRVIDLSADGFNNIGAEVEPVRDAVIADGTTINGLPMVSELPWLGQYFEQSVIGGPGAFIEIAAAPEDFARAMARKLARELMVSEAAKAPRPGRG